MRRLGLIPYLLLAPCVAAAQAPTAVPAALLGKWRVTRVLKTTNAQCWDAAQRKKLVGSTLEYKPRTLVWQAGKEPLTGLIAVERTLDHVQYAKDYHVSFAELGLPANAQLREITLQHEDEDVTGCSTEVPGDTVLLAAPGRILVSVAGVYFEALRLRSSK